MAGVSGSKVNLEARAGMARGATRSRQARPARRAIRNTFIVPVRERDCAGSGSAPDEFKLFEKSAKWFLHKESGLGGALGICYPRRTDDGTTRAGERGSRAAAGAERSRGAEHDRDCRNRAVRGDGAGNWSDGRTASANCVG